MNLLKQEIKNLFHFYIILGSTEKNFQEVKKNLEEYLGISLKANPEVYIFNEHSLSIKCAREVKKINSIKNQSDTRFFFIKSQRVEREAQNALLKTLEEPQKNTIFFLFLPREIILLDTIKSRARILRGEDDFFDYDFSESFLKSSFEKRQKIIDKISNSKKEASWKREQFLNLISDLDLMLYKNREIFNNDINFMKIYKQFLELKEQAFKKGSGVKNILIFLAITLPIYHSH